jgi:hypothetical protein
MKPFTLFLLTAPRFLDKVLSEINLQTQMKFNRSLGLHSYNTFSFSYTRVSGAKIIKDLLSKRASVLV